MIRKAVFFVLLGMPAARGLAAQSPADSAAIVLDAARLLVRQGHGEAARQLFLQIRARFPSTPAAHSADSLLAGLGPAPARAGTGRTGYILFHTLYGGFLGAAIPAAFGADGSEPYGAGLLIGAPLGYFGSRAIARSRITMPGQAGIATFATAWGTLQGLALQRITNIGEHDVCDQDFCFTDGSDTAPWAAMVVGGLLGLGTGIALTGKEIPSGTAGLISHSAFWGSWFGLSLGAVAGLEEDALFGTMMIGGNGLLLLAIPAAKAWQPSASRVRLTTAAGLAGGLAGFGIDLLVKTEDAAATLGIPAATSGLGLLIGALATKNQRDADEGGNGSGSLLSFDRRLRLGVPVPIPAAIPTDEPGRRWRPGVRISLFSAEF